MSEPLAAGMLIMATGHEAKALELRRVGADARPL
jgi:hypothetical protein